MCYKLYFLLVSVFFCVFVAWHWPLWLFLCLPPAEYHLHQPDVTEGHASHHQKRYRNINNIYITFLGQKYGIKLYPSFCDNKNYSRKEGLGEDSIKMVLSFKYKIHIGAEDYFF